VRLKIGSFGRAQPAPILPGLLSPCAMTFRSDQEQFGEVTHETWSPCISPKTRVDAPSQGITLSNQSCTLQMSSLEDSRRFVPTCALLALQGGGSTSQNLE